MSAFEVLGMSFITVYGKLRPYGVIVAQPLCKSAT